MTRLQRTIGDVYVIAEQDEPGAKWRVIVVDFRMQPVADEAKRRAALDQVLAEISSLRQHIWIDELGHQSPEQAESKR